MATKRFSLGQVLSISHGNLMCEMSQVHEILDHMTQDNLFTHQLPRAERECAPWLLRWFPQLSAADTSGVTPENWEQRLAELEREFGSTFDIEPIPRDDHIHRDPVEELEEMVGKDRIIVVQQENPLSDAT